MSNSNDEIVETTQDAVDDRAAAVAKSELYNVECSLPVVYDDIYNISFLGLQKLHPFDAGKWGRIVSCLIEDGFIKSKDCLTQPNEASKSDLLVVHTSKYLSHLKWSANVAVIMEIPPVALLPNFLVDRKALRPFRYHVGGTVLAAKLALDYGWSINLGGGFHHCCGYKGGGFCAYADITLALQFLFSSSLITSAMIVDLDAHQGNGHARDFMDDSRVYIMDMYNAGIYPGDQKAKRAIRKKVELRHHTDDKTYLRLLEQNLAEALLDIQPDILLYNAGTDILQGDPLGNLGITPSGIARRDEIVFRYARDRIIPIIMVTSGGYQRSNARIIADSLENLNGRGYIDFSLGSGS